MNTIKSFFISILLCMSIPSKGQTQDLEITFAYNRQDNALILKLFNNLIISLYDYEDGQWIRSKTINPNERLELFYSFEAIPANNVTRARLFLSTYFRDRKTGKLVSKRYKNDLPIKQIK